MGKQQELVLTENDRKKLDAIVSKMIDNKESDDNIKFVVNDFKNKYAVKKKEVSEPTTTPIAESSKQPTKPSSSVPKTQEEQEKRANQLEMEQVLSKAPKYAVTPLEQAIEKEYNTAISKATTPQEKKIYEQGKQATIQKIEEKRVESVIKQADAKTYSDYYNQKLDKQLAETNQALIEQGKAPLDKQTVIDKRKDNYAQFLLDESDKNQYLNYSNKELLEQKIKNIDKSLAENPALKGQPKDIIDTIREKQVAKLTEEWQKTQSEIEKNEEDRIKSIDEQINQYSLDLREESDIEDKADIVQRIKLLKSQKDKFFKDISTNTKELITSTGGKAPTADITKNDFDAYYDALYQEYLELSETPIIKQLKGEKGTLAQIGTMLYGATLGTSDETINRHTELLEKLQEFAPIRLLNRYQTGQTEELGVVEGLNRLKTSFMEGLGSTLTPISQKSQLAKSQDLAVTMKGLGFDLNENIKASADVQDDGSFGDYGLTDPEYWGNMVGVTAGIGLQMSSSALVGAPEIGVLKLVDKSKYLKNLANTKLIGKVLNVSDDLIKEGVKYQKAGMMFGDTEEMNFLSGVAGGAGSKLVGRMLPKSETIVGRLNKYFSPEGVNKYVAATSKFGEKLIKKGISGTGSGMGEVAEEYMQELSSIYQDDHADFFTELNNRFGTLEDATKFVISSFAMGFVMGGGDAASEIAKESFTKKMEELKNTNPKEAEKAKAIVDEMLKELGQSIDNSISEAKQKKQESGEQGYYVQDEEITKEELEKKIDTATTMEELVGITILNDKDLEEKHIQKVQSLAPKQDGESTKQEGSEQGLTTEVPSETKGQVQEGQKEASTEVQKEVALAPSEKPLTSEQKSKVAERLKSRITPVTEEAKTEATQETPTATTEQKAVEKVAPKNGDTVTLEPLMKGGTERTMVFDDGEWKQKVGRELSPISNNLKEQTQQRYDSENQQRIPSEVKGGQEPIQTEPIQATSGEATQPSGDVQKVEGQIQDPLKDVESTSKALEGVNTINLEDKIEGIVYHGTSYDIQKPTIEKYGQIHDMGGMLGKAVYYTPSKLEAEYFADLSLNKNKGGIKKIISGLLKAKKPIFVSDLINKVPDDILNKWIGLKNTYIGTAKDLKQRAKIEDSEKSLTSFLSKFGDISELARMNGNDAVMWGYEKGKPNEIAIVDDNLIETNKNKIISETYHKAKVDGSNPELVKAVEELLATPTKIEPKSIEQKEGVKPTKDVEKIKEGKKETLVAEDDNGRKYAFEIGQGVDEKMLSRKESIENANKLYNERGWYISEQLGIGNRIIVFAKNKNILADIIDIKYYKKLGIQTEETIKEPTEVKEGFTETKDNKEIEAKITVGGLRGGYTVSQKTRAKSLKGSIQYNESFDPRTSDSNENSTDSFIKTIKKKGKTYRVVGLRMSNPKTIINNDTDRSGMSYAAIVDDGNLPSNIDDLLIKRAIQEGKDLYENIIKLEDSDFIMPIEYKSNKISKSPKEVSNAIKSLKIDISKMGEGGLQSNIFGVPIALYNTLIDTIALGVEAGLTLKDAIEQAIQKHKARDVKGFDEKSFITDTIDLVSDILEETTIEEEAKTDEELLSDTAKKTEPNPKSKIDFNNEAIFGEEVEIEHAFETTEGAKRKVATDEKVKAEVDRIIANNKLEDIFEELGDKSSEMNLTLRAALITELMAQNPDIAGEIYTKFKSELVADSARVMRSQGKAKEDPRLYPLFRVLEAKEEEKQEMSRVDGNGKTVAQNINDGYTEVKDIAKKNGVAVAESDGLEALIEKIIQKKLKEEAKEGVEKTAKAKRSKNASVRKSLFEQYKKDTGSKMQSNVIPLLNEDSIKLALKVAKTYVDDGIITVNEIIEKLRIDFKENLDLQISDTDVEKLRGGIEESIENKNRYDAIKEYEKFEKERLANERKKRLEETKDAKATEKWYEAEQKTINDAIKEFKREFKKAIKEHYSTKNELKQSLKEKLLNKFPFLSDSEVEQISNYVEAEFNKVAKEEIAKTIESQYKISSVPQEKRNANTDAQKIIKAINIGMFDNTIDDHNFYKGLIAAKLGIGVISPEVENRMMQLVSEIYYAPSDDINKDEKDRKNQALKNQKIKELDELIKSIKDEATLDKVLGIIVDLEYLSMLSGISTLFRSSFGAALTSFSEITTAATVSPLISLKAIGLCFNVMYSKQGWNEFTKALRTGYSEAEYYGKDAKGQGALDILLNKSYKDVIKSGDTKTKKATLILAKTMLMSFGYNFRLVMALDAWAKTGLREFESTIDVYEQEIASKESTRAELIFGKKIRTLLALDKANIAKAKAQVEAEAQLYKEKTGKEFTKSDRINREREIISILRDRKYKGNTERAHKFANESLLTSEPQSGVMKGVYEFLKKSTDINKDDSGYAKVGKTMLRLTAFAFMRVSANAINLNLRYMPVISWLTASKSIYDYYKGSKTNRDEIDMYRRVSSSIQGTFIFGTIMGLMFDMEDDDEGNTIFVLNPESPIRVYGNGSGDYSTNKTISENFDKYGGHFVEIDVLGETKVFSYKDSAYGMILAHIGNLSDKLRIKNAKTKAKTPKKKLEEVDIADLFLGVIGSTTKYSLSQSYSQGVNSLAGLFAEEADYAEIFIKMLTTTVKNTYTPTFHRQIYQLSKSKMGIPEQYYDYSEYDESMKAGLVKDVWFLENLFPQETKDGGTTVLRDYFGNIVYKDYDINSTPDYILDILRDTRSYREQSPEWNIIQNREGVYFNPKKRFSKNIDSLGINLTPEGKRQYGEKWLIANGEKFMELYNKKAERYYNLETPKEISDAEIYDMIEESSEYATGKAKGWIKSKINTPDSGGLIEN